MPKEIIIVGSGPAALALVWGLQDTGCLESGVRVRILEASDENTPLLPRKTPLPKNISPKVATLWPEIDTAWQQQNLLPEDFFPILLESFGGLGLYWGGHIEFPESIRGIDTQRLGNAGASLIQRLGLRGESHTIEHTPFAGAMKHIHPFSSFSSPVTEFWRRITPDMQKKFKVMPAMVAAGERVISPPQKSLFNTPMWSPLEGWKKILDHPAIIFERGTRVIALERAALNETIVNIADGTARQAPLVVLANGTVASSVLLLRALNQAQCPLYSTPAVLGVHLLPNFHVRSRPHYGHAEVRFKGYKVPYNKYLFSAEVLSPDWWKNRLPILSRRLAPFVARHLLLYCLFMPWSYGKGALHLNVNGQVSSVDESDKVAHQKVIDISKAESKSLGLINLPDPWGSMPLALGLDVHTGGSFPLSGHAIDETGQVRHWPGLFMVSGAVLEHPPEHLTFSVMVMAYTLAETLKDPIL